MKYSDMERVERISATTKKLLDYLAEKQITREMILDQEPLRWTITTPLYNIGEHAYQISDDFRTAHPGREGDPGIFRETALKGLLDDETRHHHSNHDDPDTHSFVVLWPLVQSR